VSQLAEHIQQSIEDWIGRAIEERKMADGEG
jgi:hypothetical protein